MDLVLIAKLSHIYVDSSISTPSRKCVSVVAGPILACFSCGKRKFTEYTHGDTMRVYFRAEHCRAEHCRVDGKEAGGRSLPRDKSAKPTRNTKTQQDREDRNCLYGRLRSFFVRRGKENQYEMSSQTKLIPVSYYNASQEVRLSAYADKGHEQNR